jgi:hypothetical protein
MIELDQLAPAIVAFQAVVPVIPKNRTAKIPMKSGGSYSYSYADLSDMWDAVREPLKANGLAVTQALVGGSTGWTGIRTTLWHKSGQHYSEVVEIPTQDRTAQEVGSQITYYKRYALGAILGISTEEDDDGAAGSQKPSKPSKLADAKGELRAAVGQSGADPEQYAWVADATEKDVDKILGIAQALRMGKATAPLPAG